MYLGKHITNETGKKLPMVGLFDYSTTLKPRKLTLGYRKLKPTKILNKNKALILNGHEFHYSTFTVNNEEPKWINSYSNKGMFHKDGFSKNNCHTFYSHIYWASNKSWLNLLMGK